jgi:hypothetical protein
MRSLTHYPPGSCIVLCLFQMGLSVSSGAQGPPLSPHGKLAAKAALVLTPEFCASQKKQGDRFWTGVETIQIGKAACTELEPVLQSAFAALTRLTEAPPTEAGYQVVLFPRFADASATRPTAITIFNRPTKVLDVDLEWTVKDPAGKTLWIGTVQGSASKRVRAGTNLKDALTTLTAEAVRDAGEKSGIQMSSALELQKAFGFAQESNTAPAPPAGPRANSPATKCLAVKDAGLHIWRDTVLFDSAAGVRIGKKEYEVVDVVGYPAMIGQKFHGDQMRIIQKEGVRIVILVDISSVHGRVMGKKYRADELQKACR